MHRGVTILEVLLATIILAFGLAGILVSLSQSQQLMQSVPELETAQEVMDLGEMAYPLSSVTDKDEIDVGETRASELWDIVSDERMSDVQEEKMHGFTWERELVDDHITDDELKQFNNLRRVRITVTWGDRGRGSGRKKSESYIVLWRDPSS